MNALQNAHNLDQNMAILAIFKPPELYKKLSEVKYHLKFELRKSISSMGGIKIFVANFYFDRWKLTE